MQNLKKSILHGGLFGLLVGDAVGRPYEFKSPHQLPTYHDIDIIPPANYPCTYAQVPFGTWTDDGAQALALLDSLIACNGLNLDHFANCLCNWYEKGAYTPDGIVFDCGIQTSDALNRILRGVPVSDAAGKDEFSNGNGALMRVLPIALFERKSSKNLIQLAMDQCLPTHGHQRSAIACALYCVMAKQLIENRIYIGPDAAAEYLIDYLNTEQKQELETIISSPFRDNPRGSGYVVDSLWSVHFAMQGDQFPDVIRRAISLGNDTDTTAAIAGGLAGLKFGFDAIPKNWIEKLKGKEMVYSLLDKLDIVDGNSN